MSRPVTIVGAQVRPVAFDPTLTFEKFEREAETIASSWPGVDLIVFPELYLTGDDPFTGKEPPGFAESIAEPVPGPLTEKVGKVAQRHETALVAGSIFERDAGSIYNTALVFSADGELVGKHRKVFPWRPWESVAAGDRADVVDIPGVGRLGIMICYDGWFPEVARALALQGAEIIVQPSLTATSDRVEELVLARAHAIFNQCYVINVNASSTFGQGRSIGIDPEGRVLFEASTGEELISEVLDLDRVAEVRERGTRSLNQVWRERLQAPVGFLDFYRALL